MDVKKLTRIEKTPKTTSSSNGEVAHYLNLRSSLINFDRIIHSFKTALAILIGFTFINTIHLPGDQWLIITIIVVMCAQISVGSVIQKSYMRFLGTLTGSVIAAAAVALFKHDPLVIIATITLTASLFSYIATGPNNFREAGTLGAVTTTIILLGPNPSLLTAAERFLEISIGIVVAALISQFILPIHARKYLRQIQAKTLKSLREYYIEAIMTKPTQDVIIAYQDLDEAIVQLFSKQRSLAEESAREPRKVRFDVIYFNKLLQCEKEIFRSTVFMQYALEKLPEDIRNLFYGLSEVKDFNMDVCQTLEKLSNCLEQKNFTLAIDLPILDPLKITLHHFASNMPEDDIIHIDAVVFCAEILVGHLEELKILFQPR